MCPVAEPMMADRVDDKAACHADPDRHINMCLPSPVMLLESMRLDNQLVLNAMEVGEGNLNHDLSGLERTVPLKVFVMDCPMDIP